MKPKTVLWVLGGVALLVFLVRACTTKVKNAVNATFDGVSKDKDAIFWDTDFTTGEYAIILDDKQPAVLIDDAAVLEANKRKIKTEVSWMTFLPGEGASNHGIRLFKNNTLQHAVLARKFNIFQTGDVRAYGKPVARKFINEPRDAYLRKKDSLENLPNVYIERTTELDALGHDYRFTLWFPSLLVSDQDTLFDANRYGMALAQRISERLSNFKGFSVGNNAADGSMAPPILTLKTNASEHYLEDSVTGRHIVLEGYTLHTARLIFFCKKEFYDRIQQQDLSGSFEREGLSEAEIKALIQARIGPDTEHIKLSEVYESTLGGFKIGKLLENTYELRYFEVVGKEIGGSSALQ